MFRIERRYPLGLSSANWLWYLILLAGALRLSSLADAPLSPALKSWPEPVREFFALVTELGDSTWILLTALLGLIGSLILVLVLRQRMPRLAAFELALLSGFVFAGVALPSLAANLLKRAIGRGRPVLPEQLGTMDFRHVVNDWQYQGFPSGHTTTIFALVFVVGFLRPRWFPAMLALGVLVGLSRVVVGLHYPTDVIGGAGLGMILAYLVRNAFASRGWVFRKCPDGTVRPRPTAAIRRVARNWLRLTLSRGTEPAPQQGRS